MAKCDEGYLCSVCGQDVAGIAESELYLRYVIGWLDPELLHVEPEKHIRCNPVLAQFIVDDGFEPVEVQGEFGKDQLDAAFVLEREQWVTRGWRRLQESTQLDGASILDLPLPEVIERLRER
jgi:hypothetical protein